MATKTKVSKTTAVFNDDWGPVTGRTRSGGYGDDAPLAEITALLAGAARVFTLSGGIITNRTLTSAIDDKYPFIAATDGKQILLGRNQNIDLLQRARTKDRWLAAFRGLIFHEVAHIRYSPRKSSSLMRELRSIANPNLNSSGHVSTTWRTFNMLEDFRIETAYSRKFPTAGAYFVASSILLDDPELSNPGPKHLTTEQRIMGFVLTTSRLFLPVEYRRRLRKDAEQAIITEGDRPKAKLAAMKQWSKLSREYLTLPIGPMHNDNTTIKRAVDILAEAVNVLSLLVPAPLSGKGSKVGSHGEGAEQTFDDNAQQSSSSSATPGSQPQSDADAGMSTPAEIQDIADDIAKAIEADEKAEQSADKADEKAEASSKAKSKDAGDKSRPSNSNSGKGSPKEGPGTNPKFDGKKLDTPNGALDAAIASVSVELAASLDAVSKSVSKDKSVHLDNYTGMYNAQVTTEDKILVRRLTQSLDQLRNDIAPMRHKRVSSGRVNPIDFIRSVNDPNVGTQFYSHWDEGIEDKVGIEVVVLLDVSISMDAPSDVRPNKRRIGEASSVMYGLKMGMQKLGMPCTVIAFNTGGFVVYQANEAIKNGVRAELVSRGSTDPLMALKEARRLLTNSQAPHKMLCTITDGEWASSADQQTKEVVAELRRSKVITALFGISDEAINGGPHGHEFFVHAIDQRAVIDLVHKVVGSIMRDALRG